MRRDAHHLAVTAADVFTTVRLPEGVDLGAVCGPRHVRPAAAWPGPARWRAELLRIDHMGNGARPETVTAPVAGLGGAMLARGVAVDVGAGMEATVRALGGAAVGAVA